MKQFLLTVFLIISGWGAAQTSSHIFFPENVKAPLTSKEKAQIEEVYGRGATFVMERPSLLRNIKDLLRNRIEVIELPYEKAQGGKEYREARDLTKTDLYTAYNQNLTRDMTYSSGFNILKYAVNIYPVQPTVYKLGNHYITILPQARQEK